jgi:NitT/TauT family transport system substrate-binding protein
MVTIPTARVLPMLAAAALAVAAPAVASLSAARAADAEKVRIGIARTMSDAGYYVADAKGFFRDEGIAVEMVPFNSAAQMIAPLGTGELDVGGGTVAAGLYNAAARGIGLKIVAAQSSMRPGYGYSSLMVRRDLVDGGQYKQIADLKGRKVAIGAPGTGTASALNEALKSGGLKYSDVEVVYLGFPEHLPAYKNKAIDASITNEPTMTAAIDQGVAVRVVGNDVTYPDQQTTTVFYSDNFIRNRHDVAERFMRAYVRGIRAYTDALKDGKLAGPNADEIIGILTKYTTLKDPALYRRIIPAAVDPNGAVNVASLTKDLNFFRELGLIESKDITVERVIDGSFVQKAIAKLGTYQTAGR